MPKIITDPILKDLLLAHVSHRVQQLNRDLGIKEIPGGREARELQRFNQPHQFNELYYFQLWFTKDRNSNGAHTTRGEDKDYYIFRVDADGTIHG